MPRRTDPNNYWDDERREYLKEIFYKAAVSDLVLSQKMNEKFPTTSFSEATIAAQRGKLGLTRARVYSRSNKVKSEVAKTDNVPTFQGLQKKDLKKDMPVYMAETGVGRYAGVTQIGAGSAAAGTYYLFLFDKVRKMVPEGALSQADVRPLVDRRAFDDVFDIIRDRAKTLGIGSKGIGVLKDRLKSTDIRQVADGVRVGLGRRAADGTNISTNYEMLGQRALGLLADEYAAVMKISQTEAVKALEQAMTRKKAKAAAFEPVSP